MSRIYKLSADFTLLDSDRLDAVLAPALEAENEYFRKLGVDLRDADICARAIVAAALHLSAALQEHTAKGPAFRIADLGVSLN